jgi:hypothetical protein
MGKEQIVNLRTSTQGGRWSNVCGRRSYASELEALALGFFGDGC